LEIGCALQQRHSQLRRLACRALPNALHLLQFDGRGLHAKHESGRNLVAPLEKGSRARVSESRHEDNATAHKVSGRIDSIRRECHYLCGTDSSDLRATDRKGLEEGMKLTIAPSGSMFSNPLLFLLRESL
jgi:hypothetical protein